MTVTIPDENVRKKRRGKKAPATEEQVVDRVDAAISRITKSFTNESVKLSVSDLVRLLQLRKDLGQVTKGGATVRWVSEWNEQPSEE